MTLPADPLFLGLDLGTSGVRGCAVDGRGEEAASAAAALPETAGKGEKREQEPAHWWAAVEQVVAELAAKLAAKGAAGRVAALAVDGTSGTLLLADAGGEPIGPAVMYDDRRAVNEAELIAFRTASEGPRASAAHGTGSALAKLLFLHRFGYTGRARHALNQADWIVGRLTGRYGVSDDNNALKMGFDPLERRWPEWIATLGFSPGLLPQVVTPGSAVAPLRPELATRWGLPATLPVVAGTTDSTAAFIASGATKPGEAMTALGSTLVTKVLSEEPVFSPEHGVYSHRLGRLWVVGGGSNSGGAVLAAYFPPERLDELTPLLAPDRPTGLEYYPLLATGERFPVNDPYLEPRLSPRPADDLTFLQGMLEGMAAIEYWAYDLLRRLGAPYPVSVRTTGGGARNPAWATMRQRLLEVPLVEARSQEACYGTALLARAGVLRG